jgi:hypothetical protein
MTSATSVVDFEAKLSVLLSEWLSETASNDRCVDLIKMLGLAYRYHYKNYMIFQRVVLPDISVEPFVETALLDMVNAKGRESRWDDALLSGLLERGRWRNCLSEERSAYAFAALLIDLYKQRTNGFSDSDAAQHSAMLISAAPVLADWLAPLTPGFITCESIARAIFGGAWCALALSGCTSDMWIADIVLTEKPPFLPGLAPGLEQTAQTLPWMENQMDTSV